MEERLQKIISRAGVTSRRAAEELISSGRVRVNGRVVTELGQKADPQRDKIEVDGKRLVPEQPAYIVLHKPRDVVSTLRDPEGRQTVAELVRGADLRLYPVGRLDYATSGVLLMTNDGEFANAMLHPRGGVPKTYVAKVRGVMSDDDLDPWRKGVQLEDGRTLPAEARILRHEEDKTWIELTLREGRNQQIRRMGEATGWPILRLARLSFAGVTSEGIRPGEWRHLTHDELIEIRKEFGVPKRVRGVVTGGGGGHVATKRAGARRPVTSAPRAEGGAGGRGPRRDARPTREEPTRGRRGAEAGPRAEGDRGGWGARRDARPTREEPTTGWRGAPGPRAEGGPGGRGPRKDARPEVDEPTRGRRGGPGPRAEGGPGGRGPRRDARPDVDESTRGRRGAPGPGRERGGWGREEKAADRSAGPAARDRGVRDRGVQDRGVRDRGVRDRGVQDRGVQDRGARRPASPAAGSAPAGPPRGRRGRAR